LLGGLLICWGLYRTLRAWRKLAENPQRSERVA
jgi:hypothetical protein